jgi:BCS1 N terminal/ATPase family associated with various cellular activities (AAA)
LSFCCPEVDLDTTLRGAELALIPAPGRHWFWRAGRPFWVWLYRSNESQGTSQRRMESLTFQTIGRDRKLLKAFVDEVVACHRRKRRSASYLYLYDDGWDYVAAYAPRSLDSVLLKPGEKEHLMEDLKRFRASRNRYARLGVPYHRGYLLYGPPGTGKTSLVSAIGAKDIPVDPGPKAHLSAALNPAAVDAAVRKVADWELKRAEPYMNPSWTWAVLGTGFMAASRELNDPRYRDAMQKMAEKYHWELSSEDRVGRGWPDNNDQAMGQTYLELLHCGSRRS